MLKNSELLLNFRVTTAVTTFHLLIVGWCFSPSPFTVLKSSQPYTNRLVCSAHVDPNLVK